VSELDLDEWESFWESYRERKMENRMKKLKESSFLIDEGETKLKFFFEASRLDVRRTYRDICYAYLRLNYPENKTAYEVVEGMIEAFEKDELYDFANGSIDTYVSQGDSEGECITLEMKEMVSLTMLPHLKELIDDNPMPEPNKKHMAIRSDGYLVCDSEDWRRRYGHQYACIFDPSSGEPAVL